MAMLSPRRFLEKVSRRRTFWRRLPVEFGRAPLKVTPDAALRWLKPGQRAFDPMLLALCNKHVGRDSVVWDVGANVGAFAIAAAQRGGRVLAIEPDPWLHSLLIATTCHRENRHLALETLCTAIAGKTGTARLAIAQRGRASNFLESYAGRIDAGGVRATCLVPVLTLDLLLQDQQPPTVIKIDVEGAEAAVLSGAENLLSVIRPTIFVEVGETTRIDVIERLTKANYHAIDYQTGLPCHPTASAATNLIGCPL